MSKLNGWTIGASLVLCTGMAIGARAQTLTTLLTFNGTNGDGAGQFMSLVQGADGNLYGTGGGGAYNNGMVFKVTPSGTLTILYSFCPQTNCPDGTLVNTGLVLNTDGNFYGVAGEGGINNNGTVYRLTPAGVFTVLYSFLGTTDGFRPSTPLSLGTDGNLYGTTDYGGNTICAPDGCGTIFKITTTGVLTTVHSFNGDDGAGPSGGLTLGSDGNFYGTTFYDGLPNGGGTVFKMTPGGALTTLHSFCTPPDCLDGLGPFGKLIQAQDGNLYGTTEAGGGSGTVFRTSRNGEFTTIHRFDTTDGAGATAGVIQGTDGNLYGTTAEGGSGVLCDGEGCGTVFQIATGGTLTTLHNFCSQSECADGNTPYEGLLQMTSGAFYGTTEEGGDLNCGNNRDGCGTIFSLDMGLGPFVTFVRAAGRVGQTGGILGQGFTETTSVMLNGIPANFTVVSDKFITATVPIGATTGYVTVTTPSGVLTSNVQFHVLP